MAKKKNENKARKTDPNVMGLRAEVLEQPITGSCCTPCTR